MLIALKSRFLSLKFWVTGPIYVAYPTPDSHEAPKAAPSVERNSAVESRVGAWVFQLGYNNEA